MTTPTWFALAAQFNGRTVVPYAEIAQALMAISPRTAQNWRSNGRWPASIPVTPEGLCDLRDVANWWDQRRREAAA